MPAPQWLTLKTLKYVFCISQGDQVKVFTIQSDIIIKVLVSPLASFEYLCYGPL